MLDANFWQDKDNSKKVIKEKKLYEDLVNSLNQSILKSFSKISTFIFSSTTG